MGSPEDVIEEEKERIYEKYFDKKKIEEAEDPIKEVMRQARSLKGFGILKKVGESPRLAALLSGKKAKYRRWSLRDIGKVKSVRSRGASLKKLAATLGKSPGSVYNLVSRLKKKGVIHG